jgi:thiamine-phosphate pyrophosphorylase
VKPAVGRLVVITDTSIQTRFGHVELAGRAITGGAETIQFRDKSMPAGEMIETARAIRLLCWSAGVTLIINDRVDVAMAVDADGVHLGSRDLPISVARKLLGPSRLVGATAADLDAAQRAAAEGADYIGFGHIYETSSKVKPGSPKGTEALREACGAVSVPVIAIGGIRDDNIQAVLDAGAHGVAVVGAVCASPDPVSAAARLAMAIEKHAETA